MALKAHPPEIKTDLSRPTRLSDLIESEDLDELLVRRCLDRLETNGEIDRYVVGNHIMIERTDD